MRPALRLLQQQPMALEQNRPASRFARAATAFCDVTASKYAPDVHALAQLSAMSAADSFQQERLVTLNRLCVLVCFGVTLTMSTHAVEASTKVASQGETLVVATTGKLTVRVRIKTHEVQIGERPAVIESSCTYSRYPCSIVDRVDIAINGKALFVPRSAFCDLADLNTAEIKADQKESFLILYGGDASESYIAKIEFDATDVKRRTLSSSTEPTQPLQETIYHVVIVGE